MATRLVLGVILLFWTSLLAGCGGAGGGGDTPRPVQRALDEAGDAAAGLDAGADPATRETTPADGTLVAADPATPGGDAEPGAKDLSDEVRQGVAAPTQPYEGPQPVPYVPKPVAPGPEPLRAKGSPVGEVAAMPVVRPAEPTRPTVLTGGTQETVRRDDSPPTVLQGGAQQTVITGGVRTLATGVEDQGNGWVKISLDGGWNVGPSGITLAPGGDPAWRDYRLQVLRFFKQRAGGHAGQYGSARISFMVNPSTGLLRANPVSAYGDPAFTSSVEATLRQLVHDPSAIRIPRRR